MVMTSILTLILAFGPTESQDSIQTSDRDANKEIDAALGKGGFPWYDPSTGRAKPFALPREPEVSPAASPSSSGGNWSIRSIGDLISLIVFGVVLVALIVLLAWFWRIYEPIDSREAADSSKGRGEPSKVESLPAGMRREFESSDPWEEAVRRRDRGDLAGAVVCLFAHQLLTLSRLGLVRLAPGRTGRQLLRSVVDAEFRALVSPTLRQFEAVYYGHRTPAPEEFAGVWSAAEAFERRVARGVVA